MRINGGLVSRQLHLLTAELHQWATNNSVELMARYIPGKRNVVADKLSRQGQVLGMEWSLHQDIADRLFHLWGRPVLDLFTVAEDALQHPWDHLEVYAFPLFCVICHVLNRVMSSKNLRMTPVAPLWPHAEWFPVERYHQSVGSLSLHSWRFSSITYEPEVFLAEQRFRYLATSGGVSGQVGCLL